MAITLPNTKINFGFPYFPVYGVKEIESVSTVDGKFTPGFNDMLGNLYFRVEGIAAKIPWESKEPKDYIVLSMEEIGEAKDNLRSEEWIAAERKALQITQSYNREGDHVVWVAVK